MPFELPDNLHPDCAPIAWLLGTWRGNGHGDYPTIEPFQFGQEVIFTHDGRPFFHYMSRAWIVEMSSCFARSPSTRVSATTTTFSVPSFESVTPNATTHPRRTPSTSATNSSIAWG